MPDRDAGCTSFVLWVRRDRNILHEDAGPDVNPDDTWRRRVSDPDRLLLDPRRTGIGKGSGDRPPRGMSLRIDLANRERVQGEHPERVVREERNIGGGTGWLG